MLGPQLGRSKFEPAAANDQQSSIKVRKSMISRDFVSYPKDEKGVRRAFSQALSVEERERLHMARAYES
jgi:hypothetical protein